MSLGLALRSSPLMSSDALDAGLNSPINNGISRAPFKLQTSFWSFSKETNAAASFGVITSSVFLLAASIIASSIPSFLHTFIV